MGRTAVLLDFVVGLELKTAAVEGTYARVHADTLLVTHNLVKRFFGSKKFSESTPRKRRRRRKKKNLKRRKKELGGRSGKSEEENPSHGAAPNFRGTTLITPARNQKAFFWTSNPKTRLSIRRSNPRAKLKKGKIRKAGGKNQRRNSYGVETSTA